MKKLNKLASKLEYDFVYMYNNESDTWSIFERSLWARVFSDQKSLIDELYIISDDLETGMKEMFLLIQEKETTIIDL
jgi:hypothetical protein